MAEELRISAKEPHMQKFQEREAQLEVLSIARQPCIGVLVVGQPGLTEEERAIQPTEDPTRDPVINYMPEPR
jgi:hypothetical protein